MGCMKMNEVGDKEWISIYREVPKDGAVVASRIAGEEGYYRSTVYDTKTATFRTYTDYRNRLEITIWKHNEWYYV